MINPSVYPKILAVIPARAGSKRIKNKNLSVIGGKTLVDWAYEVAEDSEVFSDIVVSSDDEKMASGHLWVRRPSSISGEKSDISQATAHAMGVMENLNSCQYDYVVTLQPAVPLRSCKIIKRLINRVIQYDCGGGITGVGVVPWLWTEAKGAGRNSWFPDAYPRSQEFDGIHHWQEINSIQVAKRGVVLQNKRWDLPLAVELMPSYAVLDIDEPEDLEMADRALPVLMDLLEKDRFSRGFVLTSINGMKA